MDTPKASLLAAVVIATVLIGVIILFFVASIIRQQRRNLVLHRQSMLAEITTLEKERSRMARDLHDELAPMLAGVKMRISSFELPDQDDRAELANTTGHIDNLMKRIREITFDLMPATLERKGFVAAAREFIEFIGRGNGLDITFRASEEFRLPEQVSVNLYRILQEVVQNTLKHAQAKRLIIDLHREKKELVLSTADDGIGFDAETSRTVSKEGGIGLRSLRSRVEILNGSYFCESRKGRGTSYIFRIPFQEQL
jgi:two-component system NarL family sensor kinase